MITKETNSMPPGANGIQSWFRLPYNWDMDETLIGVPEGTKLLFAKIIEFCHSMGSDGTLTIAQLKSLSERYTRGKQSVDRLLASGALLVNSPLSPGGWSVSSPAQSVSIANAVRWLPVNNASKSIPPVQNHNRAPKEPDSVPRGGARVKKEREIEREEERTPSGSVRSSSAPAAPRVAGGATQPSLEDQEKSGVAPGKNGGTLSRSAAIALAKENIAKGRKNNPAATGIDTKFSRYDPDRPITPITSAMTMDWDPE
jgi:hypothetical protein